MFDLSCIHDKIGTSGKSFGKEMEVKKDCNFSLSALFFNYTRYIFLKYPLVKW